jgi:hypothetical protein
MSNPIEAGRVDQQAGDLVGIESLAEFFDILVEVMLVQNVIRLA